MSSSASTHTFDAQPFGKIAAEMFAVPLDRKTRARLNRGDSPRSGEPVWRNSYYVGQKEHQIWKPINGGSARGGKRWTAALLKAAKALELKTRAKRRETEPGARNGVLGEIGIAVLEYLYGRVDYATGRLEPAVRTIAEAIGRSYSAVHEALNRLREANFLNWIRRSRPKDNPEPDGPQVEQASNAYALLAPETMKGWLARLIGPAPTPACHEASRAEEKAEFERMIEHLSTVDRHELTWSGDRLLGETLKRIAAAVDARNVPTANPAGAMRPGEYSTL